MLNKCISIALLASLAFAIPTGTVPESLETRSQDNVFPVLEARGDRPLHKRCTTNLECIRERELIAQYQPRAEKLSPRQSGTPTPPTTLTGQIQVRRVGSLEVIGHVGDLPNNFGYYTLSDTTNGQRLSVTVPAPPASKRDVVVGPFTMTLGPTATHPLGYGNIGMVYQQSGDINATAQPVMRTSGNVTSLAYFTVGQNRVVGRAEPNEPNYLQYVTNYNGSYQTEGWMYSNADRVLHYLWTNPLNETDTTLMTYAVFLNNTGNNTGYSNSGIIFTGQPDVFVNASNSEQEASVVEFVFMPNPA